MEEDATYGIGKRTAILLSILILWILGAFYLCLAGRDCFLLGPRLSHIVALETAVSFFRRTSAGRSRLCSPGSCL